MLFLVSIGLPSHSQFCRLYLCSVSLVVLSSLSFSPRSLSRSCFKTITQGVLKQQEDYAWARKFFTATDHEFLMMGVYANVVTGFVPQECLPRSDAAAVASLCSIREGYKYKLAISAVHTGVLPESVIISVKRLMEFLKGHIVIGDQSNPLRGVLKSLLPKSMLSKLGTVRYPNVQNPLRQKKLERKVIEEQGSTMVRLTRCP